MRTKDEVLQSYAKKVPISPEEYETAEKELLPEEFSSQYLKTTVRTAVDNGVNEKNIDFVDHVSYFRYDVPKENDLIYDMLADIDKKVSFIYIITMISVVLSVCGFLLTMCGNI